MAEAGGVDETRPRGMHRARSNGPEDPPPAVARERSGAWRLAGEIGGLAGAQRILLTDRALDAQRRDATNADADRYRRRADRVTLVVIALLPIQIAVMALKWFDSTGFGSDGVQTSVGTAGLLLSLAGRRVIAARRRSRYCGPTARRSDLLLILLLDTTAAFHRARPHWWHRAELRGLRRRLRRDAARVENARTRLARVPRRERALRRRIQHENVRLGALLRQHADRLALAGTDDEYAVLCASLRAGLLLAAEDDWDGLLAHAPERVRVPFWRRAARRLPPVLLLAAAAFSLPELPGMHGSGDAIRASLLPIAALLLLGANESVLGPVRGVLDKTAFGGSSGDR